MVIVNFKQKALCVFMSIFNTGISALQFLILISLSRRTIEIYSKMPAFLAYASIVPLGIIELGFVIFIFSYYFKFPDMLSIFRKFLAVTGIQCLVLPTVFFSVLQSTLLTKKCHYAKSSTLTHGKEEHHRR